MITGGSRGFGLASARACAREGAAVVIAARGAEAVTQAAAALQAEGLQVVGAACDVSDIAQVEALAQLAVERFKRIDVWVNNAGRKAPYGPTAHVAASAFMQVVQTNIIGAYNGSMVALRHFLPVRRGKLINILGRGSNGEASANQNAMAASKAWAASFTRSLAREYRDSGVGIYGFNPGMMTTDFLTDLVVVAGFEGRLKQVMPAIIRMWAKPPEIPARRVAWLASAATDGKTGLELREMNALGMAAGALREGWARLTRRQPAGPEVKLALVPAALPLPPRHGAALGEKE
ncbi:MAG: putative ketoacyl reductase [Chloroflexi bacterium ADurb.Bin325]|nr:MAG: putative ketoacyl reductase [Chloroflexi bacterium ADurb.Bin325]